MYMNEKCRGGGLSLVKEGSFVAIPDSSVLGKFHRYLSQEKYHECVGRGICI